MRSCVREENGESANEHRIPLSIPSFPDSPKPTTGPTKYWCCGGVKRAHATQSPSIWYCINTVMIICVNIVCGSHAGAHAPKLACWEW